MCIVLIIIIACEKVIIGRCTHAFIIAPSSSHNATLPEILTAVLGGYININFIL